MKNLVLNTPIIKITRLVITIIFVSMFSLSAQTSRKDSGASELSVKPLHVGDNVPEDFWSHKVKIYTQGDTATIELAKYKGKPLILDFWSTSCGTCIYYFPKLIAIQRHFGSILNILLVNSFTKRDTYAKINNMPNDILRANELPSVYLDDYLIKLFPHGPIPHYVWISEKGRISAITIKEFVAINQVNILTDLNRNHEDIN